MAKRREINWKRWFVCDWDESENNWIESSSLPSIDSNKYF